MKEDAFSTENIPELKRRIAELEALVKYYEARFRLTQHRQFGATSEKSEYDQLSFFDEAEATADANAAEPTLVEIAKHYRKAKRTAGERLPEDLPVQIVEHDLPPEEQVCPECGGAMHVMGRETRRELKIIPAQAVIVEHIRKVYSCRDCETDECGVPIRKAPVDEPVIKGSFASPEAVAQIMTQKFVMGVPLYRQEQEWNRNGILLSRQTISNWVIRCAEDWLEPIYGMLHEAMVINHSALHADETVLQVLKEPGKTAQSKSYMWLYRTSGFNARGVRTSFPIVLYDYQPDRRAERPKAFLKDFKGYLHTDGYKGYHPLPEEIIIVGCWAHARRKFDEALKSMPLKEREGSGAHIGKGYCDRLFAIERALADLSPKERYEKRHELAKPVLDAFFVWLNSKQYTKNATGEAVSYTLDYWKYLERYLLDGQLEISNNCAERSVKPFVIGRKNWLFANTQRGARASAIVYSIIETAKECGLDPYRYLTYIFKNAPNWNIRNDPNRLELLLPWCVPEYCKAAASN